MEALEFFGALFSFIATILGIILFFKVWGMTNDISALKKYYCVSTGVDASKRRSYICECVVLDDKANLKRALLQNFIDKINNKCNPAKNVYLSESDKQMSFDITPEVEMLKNQFAKVNMEVPEAVLNMKTCGDFYQFFKLSELTIKK